MELFSWPTIKWQELVLDSRLFASIFICAPRSFLDLTTLVEALMVVSMAPMHGTVASLRGIPKLGKPHFLNATS